MGRIYYLLGKSATGKDTLYKEILKRRPKLRTVTMYTTRPIREGETDGVEYFFTDREELERQLASGKVIESRTYQTIAGPWTYYTVDDGQFDVADISIHSSSEISSALYASRSTSRGEPATNPVIA